MNSYFFLLIFLCFKTTYDKYWRYLVSHIRTYSKSECVSDNLPCEDGINPSQGTTLFDIFVASGTCVLVGNYKLSAAYKSFLEAEEQNRQQETSNRHLNDSIPKSKSWFFFLPRYQYDRLRNTDPSFCLKVRNLYCIYSVYDLFIALLFIIP